MTMDNGEGRPLDEAEAGNEDPQGWYFDLPGGAWERQEEKNRTLRQRVLGNLSEDDAKARSAPFGRKPLEPEEVQKKGGRGFFGRRKKDDEESGERTSAGGTWVLNRGGQPQDDGEPTGREPQYPAPDDDADDWSTEPPLKLSPFPRSETPAAPSWGESDAGFDLAPPPVEASDDVSAVTEQPSAIEEDSGTEGFLASMRAWSQGSDEVEVEPEVEAPDEAQFRVPTYEEAVASGQIEPEAEPEDSLLTLRPRPRDDSEKRLDWDFGPAAWEEPSARSEDDAPAFEAAIVADSSDEPASLNFESMRRWADEARETDHPHFTVHHAEAPSETAAAPGTFEFEAVEDAPVAEVPAFESEGGAEAEESSLASMRRWAESRRDGDHPHFSVSHHEVEEPDDDAAAVTPIPLRPRNHEDAPPASSFAPAPPSESGDEASRMPLQLPIVRRSHDEDEAPVQSEKWNDFFALKPVGDEEPSDGEGSESAPPDGLAAMRAWAQQRQEPEAPQDIPEEFLKPFDWELEEAPSVEPGDPASIPAELLKPFDWETAGDDESAEAPGAFEVPAFSDFEPVERAAALDEPAPAGDPLEGIFPATAHVAPPVEEKKKGRFGRLFGRGKKDPTPAAAPEAAAESDWLPVADEPGDDIRVAAKLGPWEEDAGTVEASEATNDGGGEGWGGSLASRWADNDRAAFREFSESVADPVSEWAPEEADQPALLVAAETNVEQAAFEDAPAAAAAPAADAGGWDPEPVAAVSWVAEATDTQAAEVSAGVETPEPDMSETWNLPESEAFAWEPETPAEAVASVESVADPAAEKASWEQPAVADAEEAPVEAVASVEAVAEPAAEKSWWEHPAVTDEAEEEAPVEAVASLEAAEEPVAEKPWWEQPAVEAEPGTPVEAVASVEAVEEPVAVKPWWEQPAVEDADDALVEAAASVDAVEEPAAETPWWEQPAVEDEPATPVETLASVEAAEEPAAEKSWWEQPAVTDEAEEDAPVEAIASVEAVEEPVAEKPRWEQPAVDAEEEAPVEAVASVEPVEEPAAEKPWWEQPAVEAEEDALVEAVASVEPVEEPAAEKSWWEQPAITDEAEEDAPVEAVASVEAGAEPAAEKPWWEQPAVEAEEDAPVEAVAPLDAAEEPVAEKAWWEQPAVEAEEDAPVEAVASVEAVEAVDEPVAEKPWWEQPAVEVEEDAPIEAVASVEAVEEPAAEKPWWEQPAVEDEPATPVETLASVEAAEEPAAEKSWWEQPAVRDEAEEDAPVEAVASVEAVEEPAAEKAWWEQPAVEDEAEEEPVEAVASVEAVDEPVAEKAWWEQPAVEDEPATPVETLASVEAAEEPAVVADDDDPWADFVNTPADAGAAEPAVPAASLWGASHAGPSRDEDMWGHVAAQAEEHAAGDHQLDLAASLESQMAEEQTAPAYEWAEETPRRDWPARAEEPESDFLPEQEDDDVILAAFERHAATPEPVAATREADEAFAELLGAQAADIVAEASDDGGQESFIKMSSWAPQRQSTFDGGWAPQQEVEQQLSSSQPVFGGSDGAGFAPPPWAVNETDAEGEPAAAAGGRQHTKVWVRELVETVLLALLVFLSVRASFQNFRVEGSSMYPTLENGQFLIVNKLVYSEVDMEKLSNYVPFIDAGSEPKHNVFHGPERGDIIVLKDPRDTDTDLIKRVIGLPGETLEIIGGKVYINDQLLEEPYIQQAWHDSKPKILIPPGEYFVMGDNRDNSLDSRSSQVGLVPQDLIIGKAMLSYWPKDKFGLAPNEEGTLGDQKPVLTTQRVGE